MPAIIKQLINAQIAVGVAFSLPAGHDGLMLWRIAVRVVSMMIFSRWRFGAGHADAARRQ